MENSNHHYYQSTEITNRKLQILKSKTISEMHTKLETIEHVLIKGETIEHVSITGETAEHVSIIGETVTDCKMII